MASSLTQSVSTILMVRPANFGYNKQTAESNAFQNIDPEHSESEVVKLAKAEFDVFVEKLRAHGVNVVVYEEDYNSVRTDAVFPNNWISFHDNGRVVIYPMESPNRRIEKNQIVLDLLRSDFEIDHVDDLGGYEEDDQYLEGTGSIIFDYIHGKAYACRSSRTDEGLFKKVCQSLGYEAIIFDALDEQDFAIYHTNVMMALGSGYVVICMSSIKDPKDNALLLSHFKADQLEVIDISFDQLNSFAGNMLEVENEDGVKYLAMSKSAYDSLTRSQLEQINQYAEPLWGDIPTIENIGGGSARCMMAAVHLPKKELVTS